MSGEPKPIRTAVGLAESNGTNHFCGYRVLEQLTVQPRFWTLASLSVGGPALDAERAEVFDLLAAVVTVADPRIWPLKITRLLGTWGSVAAGLFGSQLFLDEAMIGPFPAGAVAELLLDLGASEGEEGGLEARVERLFEEQPRVIGFGVAGRNVDERVEFLTAWFERHRRPGPYFDLARRFADVVLESRGLRPNILLYVAAILLDYGYSVSAIRVLNVVLFLPNFLANAVEAAEQPSELLRRLPDEFVRYDGNPPRTSPRAKAARNT